MKIVFSATKLASYAMAAWAITMAPATASATVITTPINAEIAASPDGIVTPVGAEGISISSQGGGYLDYLLVVTAPYTSLVGVAINFNPLPLGLTVGQAAGVAIGPSTSFINTYFLGGLYADPTYVTSGGPFGSYPLTSALFIGFEIKADDGQYEFGFIDLEPPQNSAGCLGICADVASYSIETSGAPIITGSSYAPEPSTLAFVAGGLLGLLAAIRASRE